ncbi:MAG: OmpH family outer membrane protein [Treponema sp.]|jgi:outer membrane protein|nr:OmpH family outer membrane protein [Treponema sp.]
MKRIVVVLLLSAGILPVLNAQQTITRFAVVDMSRVMAALGSSDRSFTEKSAAVQAEIDRRNAELQDLKAQLEAARAENKRSQIRKLEGEIKTKTRDAQDYIRTSFAELEKEKEKTGTLSDDVLGRLNNALRVVAGSEGYSMILSRQEGSGILWYSPSVDITNKVLQYLRTGKLN